MQDTIEKGEKYKMCFQRFLRNNDYSVTIPLPAVLLDQITNSLFEIMNYLLRNANISNISFLIKVF